MKKLFLILTLVFGALLMPVNMQAEEAADTVAQQENKINPKEIIFEHLGDAYGWEVPFNHHVRIPLPMILRAYDGSWHCFSSKHLEHGAKYDDGGYVFFVPEEGDFKGKAAGLNAQGEIYKPFNLSITKNVLALFIAVVVVMFCCFKVANWHRKHGYQAPRGFTGAIETLIEFIYSGVIKPTLKENSRKFAPYLLTVFMLIFFMNLLGLIVIFPGGANLTGNIAVTLVLALLTFVCTNLFATKHYWKEIFWPDVPWWLKVPIPIMPMIEVFGVFTKPAALTVRLFANMMGGHMIVIVLTLLIFIFADMGAAVLGATTLVSVFFSIFMLLIDVLVSFIQAYVFTMLSTLFISLAQEQEHKHDEEHEPEHAAVAVK